MTTTRGCRQRLNEHLRGRNNTSGDRSQDLRFNVPFLTSPRAVKTTDPDFADAACDPVSK